MKKWALILLVTMRSVGSTLAAEPVADDRIAKAKEVFERFVALGQAFDPDLADLYADDAVINNKRTLPTGEVKELSLPAPEYRNLIRSAMSLANARGDTSTYSDVVYKVEGDGVRITADRFSNLKKYHSPISILLKPDASGAWLIAEELSESKP